MCPAPHLRFSSRRLDVADTGSVISVHAAMLAPDQKAGLDRARCAAPGSSPQPEAGQLATSLDRAPCLSGAADVWCHRAEFVTHLADAGLRDATILGPWNQAPASLAS